MGLIHWFVEKTTERAIAIAGVLFATRMETAAAIEEAECQDMLEQRAQQFEADGKPQLAAALRAKAARITTDAPGDLAVHALQYLHKTDIADVRMLPAPALEEENPTDRTDQAASTGKQPARCLPRRTTTHAPHA
jgi:hypothetical protein